MGHPSSSSLLQDSESVASAHPESSSNTQEIAIRDHEPCNSSNISATGNGPWKKKSELQDVQTAASVMGSSSWPALSSPSSSHEAVSCEVQLTELTESKVTFPCRPLLAVETEEVDGGSVSTEITAADDDEYSSTTNSTFSVSVEISIDGSGPGLEDVVVSSTSSSSSTLTHTRVAPIHSSSRQFNHGQNQNYRSPRLGSSQRGNGFNSGGGNRGGNGFLNQNYLSRRRPRGFNNYNYNRGFNADARMMNFQLQPHGFVNGPAGFFRPPPLPPQHFSHSNAIVNPPYFNVPPPPPPPLPVQGPIPPFGYYSNPYFPVTEGSTPYYPPVPAAPSYIEGMDGAPLYPQPNLPAPPPPPYVEVRNGAPHHTQPKLPVPPPYVEVRNGAPHYTQPNLPHSEVDLCNKILRQIEFYFSEENLQEDSYLKKQMDNEGWVPVKVIARFNRIKAMTDDANLIVKALESSASVEVKGDKMRKRGEWMMWISPTQTSSSLDIVSGIQNMRLDYSRSTG